VRFLSGAVTAIQAMRDWEGSETERTRGRRQTPAEVLVREDRDRGHRDDY